MPARRRQCLKPHAAQDRKRIKLGIGDVAVSADPTDLHTVLGSCVAVCLYDPILRAGGMNHILLPVGHAGDISMRYGVHAMEVLINQLMNLGCDRRRLIAKVFGGANLLHQIHEHAVGKLNATFVRGFLSLERIPLVAERLGGRRALEVNFQTDSSRALVRPVSGHGIDIVAEQERCWKRARARASADGEITLF